MTGRPTGPAPLIMVALAVLVSSALYVIAAGPSEIGRDTSGQAPARPGASATASPAPKPPEIKVEHATCCAQAARFLNATWTSSERVSAAELRLEPAPPFECETSVDASGVKGRLGCRGLLPGGIDHIATLTVRTAAGSFPVQHRFRTMGDRLTGVKWFTEFEDPTKDPLACAAASARIIQVYTSGGTDPMTAEQILALGRGFNRSRDPGLDPVAIAAVQKRLDPRNNYHYYRFASKEDATKAAVYWLMRSGKPVHMITLAGQHDPVLIGFSGAFGTYFDDPVNRITGMIVQDPQRGDLDPRTQSRRPDKYRSAAFQTGALVGMDEWYRDEWWFGFSYARIVDGVDIERNDGTYTLPHWAGTYTIIVDDGDTEWPPEREGRVKFR